MVLSLQCVIRASQRGVSYLTLLCLSNKKHPQHWRNDSFNRSPSYSEELPHDLVQRCSEFTWAQFHYHLSPSSLQGSINVYSNKKDGSRDEPALNTVFTENLFIFPLMLVIAFVTGISPFDQKQSMFSWLRFFPKNAL